MKKNCDEYNDECTELSRNDLPYPCQCLLTDLAILTALCDAQELATSLDYEIRPVNTVQLAFHVCFLDKHVIECVHVHKL